MQYFTILKQTHTHHNYICIYKYIHDFFYESDNLRKLHFLKQVSTQPSISSNDQTAWISLQISKLSPTFSFFGHSWIVGI